MIYTKNSPEWHFQQILKHLGEDVTREGLKDTPKRYIKFLKEFFEKAPYEFTSFEGEGMDEMIICKNIPFFSMCEHHLAPFFGTASIAYVPDKRVVGLSKLPRTLDFYAKRLQNQERITKQVAEKLMKELHPKGAAVLIKARHLCVEMRGVQKHDTWTVTSYLTGCFKKELNCRQEFLKLAQ